MGFLMGHPHHYNSHHEAAAAAHGTTPRMRCSFKQATAVVCGGNIVVVLYLLHSLLVPLYIRPGASHSSIVLIRQNGLSSFFSLFFRFFLWILRLGGFLVVQAVDPPSFHAGRKHPLSKMAVLLFPKWQWKGQQNLAQNAPAGS